jgi:predicted acetyltransferase
VADLRLSSDQCFSLPIALTDSLLPENNKTFTLEARQGGVSLCADAGARASVAMDIGVLAQLCFGAYGALDLWRAARIKSANQEHAALLQAIFPVNNNYINEYF